MIHFLSFYSVAIPNLAVTLNNLAAAWPSLPVQLFPVRFPLPTPFWSIVGYSERSSHNIVNNDMLSKIYI